MIIEQEIFGLGHDGNNFLQMNKLGLLRILNINVHRVNTNPHRLFLLAENLVVG